MEQMDTAILAVGILWVEMTSSTKPLLLKIKTVNHDKKCSSL